MKTETSEFTGSQYLRNEFPMKSVSFMLFAALWKSSQVGVFISREFRNLLLLINLNKQNDFTPC